MLIGLIPYILYGTGKYVCKVERSEMYVRSKYPLQEEMLLAPLPSVPSKTLGALTYIL